MFIFKRWISSNTLLLDEAITKNIQKLIAKKQLKLLPNPLKDYPSPVNAYTRFIQENFTKLKQQLPDSRINQLMRILASKWIENQSIQEEFRLIANHENQEISDKQRNFVSSLNRFDFEILKRRRLLNKRVGKQSLSIKDPLKPKKSQSAYLLYFLNKRSTLSGSAVDIMRQCAAAWKSLDPLEKSQWIEKSQNIQKVSKNELDLFEQQYHQELELAKKTIQEAKKKAIDTIVNKPEPVQKESKKVVVKSKSKAKKNPKGNKKS